jgi:ABC-type amino acid transport substrate-binding protein
MARAQIQVALAVVFAMASLVGSGCALGAAPSPTPTAVPAAAPTAASGSSATIDFKLVNPGVLTVATYGNGPPDIIIGSSGELTGLEGELLNMFASRYGLELKLFETTFASMILSVKEHKADVGTYIFYNKDRAAQVYYTLPHWVADHAAVYTLKTFNYTGPKSLDGKMVGTVNAFVWQPFLQQYFGGNAKFFPDQVVGGTALLNGQIDGWVNGIVQLTQPPFDNAQDRVEGHLLNAGDFDMPDSAIFNDSYRIVSCDNKQLAMAMDKLLLELINNGQWAQIMAKYNVKSDEAPRVQSPPEQLCNP